jgi:hypothetical protein
MDVKPALVPPVASDANAARDAGVYVLIFKNGDQEKYLELPSKKDVLKKLEEIGKRNLVKLYKSAKEVDVQEKVVFTF